MEDSGVTTAKAKPRSLAEFVRDKRRADCPVCALPLEVRAEVKSASEKKIKRTTVLEWLKLEYDIDVSAVALDKHHSQRHEQ